jgi:hypothetical protein
VGSAKFHKFFVPGTPLAQGTGVLGRPTSPDSASVNGGINTDNAFFAIFLNAELSTKGLVL